MRVGMAAPAAFREPNVNADRGSADDSCALVDFDQIDSLIAVAGREGVASILDAFWRSTDGLLDQLRRQINAGDFTEAARTSHAIKGSAANVGANLLADLAREAEGRCKGADAAAAGATQTQLVSAYAQTRAALIARLADAA